MATVPAFAPDAATTGPRRSLVLAGGGMRVAYQAGVLRALHEAGLRFHHADGASGGNINLAMLLSGPGPVEMCDRWRSLHVPDFASLLPWRDYLDSTGIPALGDSRGLREKVFPHLGIDFEAIRSVGAMDGTFNVCDFRTKRNVALPHGRIDLDYLVAAVSLPIFMPPVEKDGGLWMDSAWIKDANLWEAVRRGAEEIWLVWCIGNSPRYRNGVFHQYVHMIELSANGGLLEEFDRIRDLNERIARGDSPHGQRNPVRLHVVKPEHPLPLDPDFYTGRIDAATLVDRGYADALRYLEGMTENGVAFGPEATAMSDPSLGITFRETMSGGFSLGETDPHAGAAAHGAATLSMHATVSIDDIDRFAANPAHLGSLLGTIDFPPLGTGIPASRGVFNLFSPTDQPALKLMVYELAFVHDGKPYYLAGRKEVRDDPGFDLWKDTTTLFTTLHEGDGKDGPVAGAGILTLGVVDLVRLVSTISVIGAHGPADTARAISKFGTFFLGELWKSYGPKS